MSRMHKGGSGPRWSRRADGLQMRTPRGTLVLLEESHDLPLVDFEVTVRTGSVHDPVGREGLARLAARMIRMGTAKIDGPTVEDTIARLGARLTVETSTSFVRFYASVIKRNVEPFVALLSKLVRRPAFRAADLAQVKRETVADIVASRDSDRTLAGRYFRAFLFGDHPYGRPVVGTRASVRAIQRADVMRHYRAHFVASNMVIGAAGDVDKGELSDLVSRYFADLPEGTAPRDRVPAPKMPRGRRVLIVDKPERTQTQIFIGSLGARAHDSDIYPLVVANTAFGGTFTARLMREVRSKRGWSYGASSRIGQDRQRDAWYMWTFPGVRDAVACAELARPSRRPAPRRHHAGGARLREELSAEEPLLRRRHRLQASRRPHRPLALRPAHRALHPLRAVGALGAARRRERGPATAPVAAGRGHRRRGDGEGRPGRPRPAPGCLVRRRDPLRSRLRAGAGSEAWTAPSLGRHASLHPARSRAERAPPVLTGGR